MTAHLTSRSELELPALRQLCLDLIEVTNSPNGNLRTIQAMIARSALLTRIVLTHINSASVGLQYEVASLELAVSLLGTRRISRLAGELLNRRFAIDRAADSKTGSSPHFDKAAQRTGAASPPALRTMID